MTAFPAIPRQPLPQEGALARETAAFRDKPAGRELGAAKDAGGRNTSPEGAKDPLKADDNGSSFRKIFLEKKAERESAENARNAPAEAGGKEKLPAPAAAARRAVRAAVRQAAVAKEGRKLSTLRDILSGLVEKNLKLKEPDRKEKARPKKSERTNDAFAGERATAFRERLDPAKNKTGALKDMKEALSRAGAEKPVRQVVIVDLRDRAAEKTKPAAFTPKAGAKYGVGKSETREMKKPAEAKDAFETKVFSKPGALPERQDAGIRPAAEETARARSDFSARMAEVMKNEMVRHTGLVLKNGGNGEIHLLLKPESLGSVRIRLNLEDNHIVGKIIVDNNTVKQIMEENLGHLETALQQNGYEAAAFDVSVAGDKRREAGEADFAGRADAERARDAAPAGEYEAAGVSIYADSLVNIVL